MKTTGYTLLYLKINEAIFEELEVNRLEAKFRNKNLIGLIIHQE